MRPAVAPQAGSLLEGGPVKLDIQDAGQKSSSPARCVTCEMLQHAPLACHDCHQVLAHVQGADYFELFGLIPNYFIDADDLARKYLGISRNIHPDKFATAGDEMQSFALRMSAAVNKAHEVLRDPFLRAEYLLESAGGPSAAQDKSVPGDLLPQVMMLREEIEEAKSSGDSDTLARIRADVTAQKRDAESRVADLCRGIDRADAGAKADLRQQLNALKYLNNLLMQL